MISLEVAVGLQVQCATVYSYSLVSGMCSMDGFVLHFHTLRLHKLFNKKVCVNQSINQALQVF